MKTNQTYQAKIDLLKQITQGHRSESVAKRNLQDAKKQDRMTQAVTYGKEIQRIQSQIEDLENELDAMTAKVHQDFIGAILDNTFQSLCNFIQQIQEQTNSKNEQTEEVSQETQPAKNTYKSNQDDAWSDDDQQSFKPKQSKNDFADLSWSDDEDEAEAEGEEEVEAGAPSLDPTVINRGPLEQLHAMRDGSWSDIPWNIPPQERKTIMQQSLSTAFSKSFLSLMKSAEHTASILSQMKKVSQLRACKNAPVVGMTSTFAALNRHLLQRLSARVVIVEEAGELLECQLMACLSSSRLEHVVMIGKNQGS